MLSSLWSPKLFSSYLILPPVKDFSGPNNKGKYFVENGRSGIKRSLNLLSISNFPLKVSLCNMI